MASWAVPSAGPPEMATPEGKKKKPEKLPKSMFYSSDDTFILPAGF